MYENLKRKIVQDMVKNGMIEKEDTELYCFGIDALKTYVGAIVMTLGIGLLMDSFWESLIFFISFKLLRVEAGGFHASSNVKCIIISIGMLVTSFYMIKNVLILFPLIAVVMCFILSVVVVWLYAPLPDENKPINEKETVYHRRKSRCIVMMETVIAMMLYGRFKYVSITIMMAVFVVTLSLVAWKIMRKLKK